MKLDELVQLSARVAQTPGRLEKIRQIAALLRRLDPDEIQLAIGFLTGWPRQGKLGAGWAAASTAREREAALIPTLELRDVDMAFDQLKAARGKSSGSARQRQLGDLFARATVEEQHFLTALVLGEVRQGALEGVMLDAIASAANVPADHVRRAAMMAGDVGVVARAVLGPEGGLAALAQYQLQLFRPVQPMLADSAPSVADAMSAPPVAIEWKLDGARVQVHRRQDRVAVYTRNLNDVTAAVPEVVAAAMDLNAGEIILDGEVIALTESGRPYSFQDTMRRFGRRLDVDALRAELPLTAFFFDILLLNGESLVDAPLSERLQRLDAVVPGHLRVPRLETSDPEQASDFQRVALARGHEGVMVKSLSAPYAAGRRGSAWLKVKQAKTLDLVVLAAEWGSGRRQGWLSNIHLGARDPAGGDFVMLGKTFKGMTDEMLAWQTKEFLARETRREGHVVYLRPELVAEIAFNEVQRSSQYPGGVALRFARVKGYRPDKNVNEADTIETVRGYLT